MSKIKLPTENKTKKCTYCDLPGTTIKFGNEKRTLCKNHLLKLNAKHKKPEITKNTFQKASKL